MPTTMNLISTQKETKQYYMDKFSDIVVKFFETRNIRGYKVYKDEHTGTLEWYNEKCKALIYATPFWDGNENIPFDAMNEEGDCIFNINVQFKPTFNTDNDLKFYINALSCFIKMFEKSK